MLELTDGQWGILIGLISLAATIFFGVHPMFKQHKSRITAPLKPWTISFMRLMATMRYNPKKLLNYSLAILWLSVSFVFLGVATLLPNSSLHLDIIHSLLIILGAGISLYVGTGLTIAATTFGIIDSRNAWRLR